MIDLFFACGEYNFFIKNGVLLNSQRNFQYNNDNKLLYIKICICDRLLLRKEREHGPPVIFIQIYRLNSFCPHCVAVLCKLITQMIYKCHFYIIDRQFVCVCVRCNASAMLPDVQYFLWPEAVTLQHFHSTNVTTYKSNEYIILLPIVCDSNIKSSINTDLIHMYRLLFSILIVLSSKCMRHKKCAIFYWSAAVGMWRHLLFTLCYDYFYNL